MAQENSELTLVVVEGMDRFEFSMGLFKWLNSQKVKAEVDGSLTTDVVVYDFDRTKLKKKLIELQKYHEKASWKIIHLDPDEWNKTR